MNHAWRLSSNDWYDGFPKNPLFIVQIADFDYFQEVIGKVETS